jgi:dTDP-4-amino-4,6-dideoxygalactose transaminase
MELVTAGEVQGTNHCLSELAAAVLLAQLEVLDAEHARREAQAAALDARLEAVEGVAPLGCAPEVTRRVFYCYVVRIDRSAFAGRAAAAVGAAVTRELGAPVFTTYPPLPRVASYRPASKRRFQLSPAHVEALTVPRFDLPVAARAHAEHLCLPHWVLLGDDADVGDIARAFDKVRRLAEALPEEH